MAYRYSKADNFRAALAEFDEFKKYLKKRLEVGEITEVEYKELVADKAKELDL